MPNIADFPDTIQADEQDQVVLLMDDGKPYKYWDDITITKSLDTIADTFCLISPFFPEKKEMRDLFRPFKYRLCALYIGGEKTITGNILKIDPEKKSNSCTVKIEGYSAPGVFNECVATIGTWPLSINGLDLKQIAEKLTKPYGIKVIFEAEPGPKFSWYYNRIQIEPDKKIYELLIEMARLRGLIISSDKNGNLIFKKTDKSRATVTIEEDKLPYVSANASYNGQSRFSELTLSRSNNGYGIGYKYTIKDVELDGYGIVRAGHEKADETEAGNLKTAAIAKLGRTIAESVDLSVELIGWRRPDGKLWSDGQKINFKSESVMIYDLTELLVRQVEFHRKSNVLDSSLKLVLPECYSGEVRTSFPWAS